MPAATRRKSNEPSHASSLWDIRLYVADLSRRSMVTFANLKGACDRYLPGRYRIDVIDVLAHPDVARAEQIVAVPTIVRRRPRPVRTAIGDLSDTGHVLAWLGLGQRN